MTATITITATTTIRISMHRDDSCENMERVRCKCHHSSGIVRLCSEHSADGDAGGWGA
jgi:hypothetical protein